jgi:hypothetical protein
MKSSFRILIPFLTLFLWLPIPKTRIRLIPLLPSSYPCRLASRSSTLHSRLDYSLYSSKSKLLYARWFTANQFVLASSPLKITTWDFFNEPPLTRMGKFSILHKYCSVRSNTPYYHFARTTQKTACIVDMSCLPRSCLAIDILLSRTLARAGMCLPSRCLALGIHVTVHFSIYEQNHKSQIKEAHFHVQ